MRHTIRTSLLLSATALFAAACTNMPMEGQDTGYNTGYTSPTTTTTTTNNIPEAGPLSETATTDTYAAAAPVNTPVPAATAPQPVPVATVPQVPAANYTPPATNSGGGGYDVYAAGNAAPAPMTNDYAAPVVDYSQPQTQPQASYNDSYTSYGPVDTAAASTNTYTPVNTSNAPYDPYANSGGGGATYTNTYASAGGSSAVQVFATGSAAKAERIRQDMQSQGLPAVVDQVGGLYKVRIPYGDEGTARANLIRVRQVSGESGAFVTTR